MANSTIEAFSISHAAILPGDQLAFNHLKTDGNALDPNTESPYFDGRRASVANDIDLYGVKEATLEADIGEFDNEGDDRVLSVWYWLNYANISVTQGYVPFKQIEKISGDKVVDVDAGSKLAGTDGFEVGSVVQQNLSLWSQSSLNQPQVPLLLRMPAKDETSATRNFYIVLYKVQFKPLSFDGPSYKEGLMLNYEGKALVSDFMEDGKTPVPGGAVGRMVITPVGGPFT